ncbi:MAG TPA: phosphate-starvation-inducible PsiE family protein [Candidatus Dormibacteraeota bacterium]
MARKDSGYPLKTPRGRPHDLAARVFDYVEDGIYIVVAVLLFVAGLFVLGNAIAQLVSDIGKSDLTNLVINILDNGLLLFIVAELLHTVRATIQERTLVVEPFLIVGLIAGVRRLLVLTAQIAAQNQQGPGQSSSGTQFSWTHQGIEMTVLLGLILGMTIALVLYHRYHGAGVLDREAV